MNKILKFLWRNEIYDGRLPNGCKFLNCCSTCPAYCNWKKVKLLEYKNHYNRQYTLRDIL